MMPSSEKPKSTFPHGIDLSKARIVKDPEEIRKILEYEEPTKEPDDEKPTDQQRFEEIFSDMVKLKEHIINAFASAGLETPSAVVNAQPGSIEGTSVFSPLFGQPEGKQLRFLTALFDCFPRSTEVIETMKEMMKIPWGIKPQTLAERQEWMEFITQRCPPFSNVDFGSGTLGPELEYPSVRFSESLLNGDEVVNRAVNFYVGTPAEVGSLLDREKQTSRPMQNAHTFLRTMTHGLLKSFYSLNKKVENQANAELAPLREAVMQYFRWLMSVPEGSEEPISSSRVILEAARTGAIYCGMEGDPPSPLFWIPAPESGEEGDDLAPVAAEKREAEGIRFETLEDVKQHFLEAYRETFPIEPSALFLLTTDNRVNWARLTTFLEGSESVFDFFVENFFKDLPSGALISKQISRIRSAMSNFDFKAEKKSLVSEAMMIQRVSDILVEFKRRITPDRWRIPIQAIGNLGQLQSQISPIESRGGDNIDEVITFARSVAKRTVGPAVVELEKWMSAMVSNVAGSTSRETDLGTIGFARALEGVVFSELARNGFPPTWDDPFEMMVDLMQLGGLYLGCYEDRNYKPKRRMTFFVPRAKGAAPLLIE